MKKIICLTACLFASGANAGIINSTFESMSSNGNHRDYGNAVVISDNWGEQHRGYTEFDISGLSGTFNAFLNFDLTSNITGASTVAGLDFYEGNGVADLFADWSQNANEQTFVLGSAPNSYSLDISSVFNSSLSSGWNYLGVNLHAANWSTLNNTARFDNFNISYEPTAVPEPASFALLGLGLAGLGFSRRKKAA